MCQADRITGTGYTYDPLGRTRTVSASDTDAPDGSNLTAAYHANDMVAALTQSAPGAAGTVSKSKTYGLDASARIGTIADTVDGLEVREVVNHYDDSSDNPSWVTTKTRPDANTPWEESWTRNIEGIDGDLAITATRDGTAELQIANLHDDILATVDVANPTSGLTGYSESTEYGITRDPAAGLGGDYGWLGIKQRSTDTIGGLTLMGARLYNPATGLFLSRDPVRGGNDNSYIYPADPINKYDLTGEWWTWGQVKKTWKKHGRKAVVWSSAAGAAYACGVSIACAIAVGAVAGAAKYRASTKKPTRGGTVKAAFKGAASGAAKTKVKRDTQKKKKVDQHYRDWGNRKKNR